MRVAIFYPYNTFASWYTLGGYRSVLQRMGHDVVDCVLPGNQPQNISAVRKKLPTIEQLSECDVVLVAFAEYIRPWLTQVYGIERWKKIKAPVIFRYDESFDRADLRALMNWEELRRWADFHSFPAAQDAERFGGRWQTYGVDLEMFNTGACHGAVGSVGQFDLAFIGSLYQKRAQYAQRMVPHLGDIEFRHAPVIVQDLSGVRDIEQTNLLAYNYQRMKIFFCLPPLSQLLVMKLFEVMACGTFVMYPRLFGEAEKNLGVFNDREHLVYYDEGDFVGNAAQIRCWLADEEGRRSIAEAGCREIHAHHSLEQMFEKIFEPIGVRA